ncbi:MAG: hypothetical protein ACD_9C00286G0001, partial [uncultured bacterium]
FEANMSESEFELLDTENSSKSVLKNEKDG